MHDLLDGITPVNGGKPATPSRSNTPVTDPSLDFPIKPWEQQSHRFTVMHAGPNHVTPEREHLAAEAAEVLPADHPLLSVLAPYLQRDDLTAQIAALGPAPAMTTSIPADPATSTIDICVAAGIPPRTAQDLRDKLGETGRILGVARSMITRSFGDGRVDTAKALVAVFKHASDNLEQWLPAIEKWAVEDKARNLYDLKKQALQEESASIAAKRQHVPENVWPSVEIAIKQQRDANRIATLEQRLAAMQKLITDAGKQAKAKA
ncbi:hypothetical protein [Aeromonas salmonicida]|uniref:hypothetical protein n=1 Tax=Aeromonas salmonicida TaxID=645 RepID=UPI0038B6EC29